MRWSEYKNDCRIRSFTKHCLNENIEIVKSCWTRAKTVEEFATKIFDNKGFITPQAYWLLSKDFSESHMTRVKKWLSDKDFERVITNSDMGCVAIGNNDFKFNVNNGYGDGETYVYIFQERMEEIDNVFNFISTFQGNNINIYKQDTYPEEPIYTLPKGRYGIYVYNGVVAIEKISNAYLGEESLSEEERFEKLREQRAIVNNKNQSTRVYSNTYGEGTVLEKSGYTATIQFDNGGTRRIFMHPDHITYISDEKEER